MRVVTNEALINRNRKISHILFFVSLIGMGAGFFFTWTQPEASSTVSCMILPLLMLTTLASVRMANTWIREPRPESVLEESFKGLGQKYTLFNHLMPAPHVLIGPEGVFAINPLWQEGTFRVSGSKWHGQGGLTRRLMGYLRQDSIGNPFQDARFYASEVQKVINRVAPDSEIEVQPLVVFTSPKAELVIEDPALPVLYADNKRKPSLRQYLRDRDRDQQPTLTEEDLDALDRMYGLVTRQELESFEMGDLDADEDVASDDITSEQEAGEGVVYVIRMDQLYKIGVTYDSVEEELNALAAEHDKELELVHTIETPNPEAVKSQLQRRFGRKRQKEDWYGLGRKDVSWIRGFDSSEN